MESRINSSSADFKYKRSGVNRMSSSSESRQLASHSRSKSVDDISRIHTTGSAEISTNNHYTSGRTGGKRSIAIDRDFKSLHDLSSDDHHVSNRLESRHISASDSRVSGLYRGGHDHSSSNVNITGGRRIILEESGSDQRRGKDQYRIVGRITRSPSPEPRYRGGGSHHHHHQSIGVSGGLSVSHHDTATRNNRNVEVSRGIRVIDSDYSRRDQRSANVSRSLERGRSQKEDIRILGGSRGGCNMDRGSCYPDDDRRGSRRDGGGRGTREGGNRGGRGGMYDFDPESDDQGMGGGGRIQPIICAGPKRRDPERDRVNGRYGSSEGLQLPSTGDGGERMGGGRGGGREIGGGGVGGGGRGGGGVVNIPFYRGDLGRDGRREPHGGYGSDPGGDDDGRGSYGRGGRGSRDGGRQRPFSPDYPRGGLRGKSLMSGVDVGYPTHRHQRGRSTGGGRNPRPSVRRSRSMNDLRRRSPSPNKHNDSHFPVCSRFPNCSVCTIDIPQNQNTKEALLMSLEDKGDDELLIEQKDKEIQIKSESILQITQMLQKTKKELEMKIVEVNRKDIEVKQLKEEMKRINEEKKSLESFHSEHQVTMTKMESVEIRLKQMTDRCDTLIYENKDLTERIKQLEITEKDFYTLEENVYDLQIQLRDMENVEIHRDELIQKLQSVKKQRDEFLAKGKLVEEERNEFSKSNKTLEQYLVEWKRKTTDFKQANSSLKQRILILEKEKKELEVKIDEIQSDRVRMQSTICSLEAERDDIMQELKQVVIERNTLEQRLAELEDMLGDHDQLEEGFHSLRLKVSDLTRQREDAEITIHTYKTKVQNLKKSIRSKEDTILQLTHDIKTLKVAIDNFSPHDMPALKSLEPLGGINAGSGGSMGGGGGGRGGGRRTRPRDDDPTVIFDPNRDDGSSSNDSYDIVAIRNQNSRQPLPHHHHIQHRDNFEPIGEDSIPVDRIPRRKRPSGRSRQAKKYVALFDYDPVKSSTSDYPERELRLREGDYITVFGEMDSDGYLEAEINGVRGLIPGIYVEELSETSSVDVHHHTHKLTTRDQRDRQRIVSRERTFVALYDYDPYTMGTTDRPDLQLSLKKGDTLTVIGDVDVEGYFTATVNGRRGLVPSNFVEEYSQSSHSHMREERFQGTVEVDAISGPPYAPRDLKVTRVVTRNAVLLSWLLPAMDDHYYSNGSKVIGYRLWVNGQRRQDVDNPSCNKALIDGVDLTGRVEFSIQTIGYGEMCSEKCHFAITGALSTLESNETLEIKGDHEVFVALFDYDPLKSSPNPNPSLELAFREGDLMIVYDKSRSDGFYSAKMNGKKGLVPSNFIQVVKKTSSSSSSTQMTRHSSSVTRHVSSINHDSDSNSRRVQFESKKN